LNTIADDQGAVQPGPGGLHYQEAGTGKPLVLLHGSGPGVSGWSNFGANVPTLSAEVRTIVVDQPGFGRSPAPVLDRPYGDIAADAVVSLLDHLGLEQVDVLGNSMGGATACRIALAHPDRVDRLVLMGPGGVGVNTTGPRPTEGFKRMVEFSKEPTRERMVEWLKTMVADQSMVTDELVDSRMAGATAPGAIEWFRTFLSPHAARMGGKQVDELPLWAQAAKIRHRTLITWGRDDRVVPFETGLLPLFQMPRVELHVFGPCGHWPMVERKADFERVVLEFLTRP
jgi:pimeloyl-ACP methyl ester carboxylesterase